MDTWRVGEGGEATGAGVKTRRREGEGEETTEGGVEAPEGVTGGGEKVEAVAVETPGDWGATE